MNLINYSKPPSQHFYLFLFPVYVYWRMHLGVILKAEAKKIK